MLLIFGIAATIWELTTVVLLQAVTPRNMLGIGNSVYGMFLSGGLLAGAVIAGPTGRLDVVIPFAIAGIGLATLGLYGLYGFDLKRLPQGLRNAVDDAGGR